MKWQREIHKMRKEIKHFGYEWTDKNTDVPLKDIGLPTQVRNVIAKNIHMTRHRETGIRIIMLSDVLPFIINQECFKWSMFGKHSYELFWECLEKEGFIDNVY